MALSRRGFFTGLAALVAAPAIVKVESLMKLAPTEVLRPDISLQLLTDYSIIEKGPIERLDVLYGHMYVRPEWAVTAGPFTLDDYCERILPPMVEKMSQQFADAVMYGTGAAKYDLHGMRAIGLADLLGVAPEGRRATPSDG